MTPDLTSRLANQAMKLALDPALTPIERADALLQTAGGNVAAIRRAKESIEASDLYQTHRLARSAAAGLEATITRAKELEEKEASRWDAGLGAPVIPPFLATGSDAKRTERARAEGGGDGLTPLHRSLHTPR
jgi:hypothetical protein